jgi:tetratricopeptide (TPR) repeat protein
MASGGHGGEALMLRARDELQAAEAVLAEVEAWTASGEWPRLWATAPVAMALARAGDFERARRHLDSLLDNGIYRGRQLEARCVLIAEQRAWDKAGAVVADAREHGAIARLEALPLHADRLEGRAALAAGDAEGAVALLQRAAGGFLGLAAAWEAAQVELSLGEALVALGRGDEAAAVLSRAAEVFERLRVPRELAQARELLEALTIAH